MSAVIVRQDAFVERRRTTPCLFAVGVVARVGIRCVVLTLWFRCQQLRTGGSCIDVARGKYVCVLCLGDSFGSGLSVTGFSRSSTALSLGVLTWLDFKASSSVYVVCRRNGHLRVSQQRFNRHFLPSFLCLLRRHPSLESVLGAV